MPNGEKYVLFYMKLLVESISHEGLLRFSETIPYKEDMLATITNMDIDIVRSAIKVFTELELMNILDDGTLHMIETEKMMGSETEWAIKKRAYKEKQQLEDEIRGQCPLKVLEDSNLSETNSDKSKSKSIEKYNPSDDLSFFNDPLFQSAWKEYKTIRTKNKCSNSDRAIKTLVNKIVELSGEDMKIAIGVLNQSSDNGWKTVYPVKGSKNNNQTTDEEADKIWN